MLALAYGGTELNNFRRWQAWDAQRYDRTYYTRYVDYATVAIGLNSAAAGIPEAASLRMQNSYAKDSRYAKKTIMSKVYPNLPERNVTDTETGYRLYHDGAVGADKK